MKTDMMKQAREYLDTLCVGISNRAVGSTGNRDATGFFRRILSDLGWETESDELDAMDWEPGKASIKIGGDTIPAASSPYSKGCEAQGSLVCVSCLREFEETDIAGSILLLHGEIAREQLMPKNFVFYNPEEHQRIISLLENGNPAAIICATGRNSALAGGAYPFPLIEDGDFDIPSVYITDVEGRELAGRAGEKTAVSSSAVRIPSKAWNVTGRRGSGSKRIVITAHIDAKKGTPGAIDNATGVITLLLLAELLSGYGGPNVLEIVAFNGEDYYAVPGQMDFIRRNEGRFGNILLNINIDGAGYLEGPTAFSFYGVPDTVRDTFTRILDRDGKAVVGPEWPQGDHSIFVQYGVPAVAVSSLWFTANMESQAITHTPADNPDIVDLSKVLRAAEIIALVVERLDT